MQGKEVGGEGQATTRRDEVDGNRCVDGWGCQVMGKGGGR